MSKADKVMTMQCRTCGSDFTVARKATAVQQRFCINCIPAPQAPKVFRTVVTEPTDLVLKCEYEHCGKKFTVARRAVGGQRSLMRRFCCMEHAWQARREWRAKRRRKYDPDKPKPIPVKDYSRSKFVDETPAQPENEPAYRELRVTRDQWEIYMRLLKREAVRIFNEFKSAEGDQAQKLMDDRGDIDEMETALKRIGWI